MSRHSVEYLSYSERKKLKYKLFFLIKFIVLFFVLYHIITVFIFSSYTVENVSMEPLLKEGDYVFTAPVIYGARIPLTEVSRFPGFSKPERGEIIITLPGNYKAPSVFIKILDPVVRFFTLQKVSLNKTRLNPGTSPFMVKRIVGVPGDTIRMDNFTVYIKSRESDYFLRESELIDKDYNINRYPLPEGWEIGYPFSAGFEEIKLKENEFYLLGDNRSNSHDSRHYGPVPLSHIITKVVFRYWPPKHIGVVQ